MHMAWEAIYEDLSIYDSATHSPGDLPLDRIQAIVIDGKTRYGSEYVGFGRVDDKDVVLLSSTSPDLILQQDPSAIIVRGSTTTTRRFNEIKQQLGDWDSRNVKPDAAEPAWVKDMIGWRCWTSKDVFDSKLIAESDWQAHWSLLPDDVQVVMLYENWVAANGVRYRQIVQGSDQYFMASGPEGKWIIDGSNAIPEQIVTRYPGAIVKAGKLTSLPSYRQIVAEAMADVVF